ncbi:hypothetical protein POM88_053012 [Heracleum sosnowskyi]|uniref:Uncharacterized protein n=1 Tax=Heracleum sosnowskyi TaxID=360622 RepID=A0AAD8GS06_9APIA|nr:hypothetical protein POM88_053012 [Heracleum sosnowskyi]
MSSNSTHSDHQSSMKPVLSKSVSHRTRSRVLVLNTDEPQNILMKPTNTSNPVDPLNLINLGDDWSDSEEISKPDQELFPDPDFNTEISVERELFKQEMVPFCEKIDSIMTPARLAKLYEECPHPTCSIVIPEPGMAPKVPSFIKRSKNVDEIFKTKTETKEVPLEATPVSQVPTPTSAQTQPSGSSKRKLAQTTLDLSGSSQTRSMRKGKAIKVDPATVQNQFQDLIDTHVPAEVIAGWSKMDSTEALEAMRFSAAQNTFFTLRFCDDFALKTQYDLRLQGEVEKLKQDLVAAEERANVATVAARRIKTAETTLKKEKEELQEQVKSLKDDKISLLEKVHDLEVQVDALNVAATSVKSLMLTKEKARYDEGYDEGIRDYMRSMWEKMPELNWSLLGEDVVNMIHDFKREAMASQDPVPPVDTVERPLGSVPVATEVPATEDAQPALPTPPAVEDPETIPSA